MTDANYFCQLCGRSMGAETGTAHVFCADFRQRLRAEQARTDMTALTEATDVVARAKQRRDELARELSPSPEDVAERVAIERIIGVPAPAQPDPMLEVLDFTGPEGPARLRTFVASVIADYQRPRDVMRAGDVVEGEDGSFRVQAVVSPEPGLSDKQALRLARELTRRLSGRRLPMVVIDYVLGECLTPLSERSDGLAVAVDRVNVALRRRAELNSQAELSEADQAEVGALTRDLDALMFGHTVPDQDAWQHVRRFADALREGSVSLSKDDQR